MLNLRASISIIALLVGISIFIVSLITAAEISFGSDVAMSERKFYLSSQILPDNVLYPLVTGTDRVRMNIAGRSEKISLMLDYSQRRHQAALRLIEKGENELAIVTFRKSLGYIAEVASGITKIPASSQFKLYLLNVLNNQLSDMKSVRNNMTEAQQQQLNAVIADAEVLEEQLKSH